MEDSNSPKNIRHSFESLPWHDSKLLEIRIINGPSLEDPDLRLRVKWVVPIIWRDERLTRSEIRFREARIFRAEADLLFMGYCGGDISSAYCTNKSEFLEQVAKGRIPDFSVDHPEESASNWYFAIHLIPPNGSLDIVAADFEIVRWGND